MHRRYRLALHRLRLPAAAVVAAGALVLPSTALAGTLSVDHTAHTATYTANAGEANNLSFYRLSNTYRIQDTGVSDVPLTETGGALCSQGEPWKYRCPSASVATASITLGDGADTFDGSNSSVAYTITAGIGGKKITTGSGADSINVRNGVADQVACGDGVDAVLADPNDAVDASCENVDDGDGNDGNVGIDPTSDPTGGAQDGNGPNVFHTPVGLTVALSHVPVKNTTARLKLACALNADAGCHGDVILEAPPAKKAKHAHSNKVVAARGQYVARQRRHNRRLGKRSYKIGAGEKQTIAIPVRARGHFSQVSRRKRSRAVLRIVERNSAGNVIDVQTRSITLTNNGGQR